MSLVIGVAGPYGSGKSAIVEFLKERSFAAYSLSDVIRDELKSKGVAETREGMIEAGTELRRAGGPAVLAERVIARFSPARNYVVDSIRHPAEVEALRAAGRSFCLLWIDADESARLSRIRDRGRLGDPEDLQRLRELEGREAGGEDLSAQQLDSVRDLRDELIENRGSLADLYKSVQAVLAKRLYFERPGWDDYFMSIACVVASRSNCVKRKVAAVVTRDRRIISTGYNGTPRGVRNCNEGGCARCGSFGPGGEDLGECVCSHGEENAIIQAAYHGVSVRGGTMYTTFCPCLLCTKMIINCGLGEVVYNAEYPMGEFSLSLLREAGVEVRKLRLTEFD
jgi:dCMP deaminase